MNSKNSSVRILGQRSIPSAFICRPSNKSSDCKEEVQINTPSKGSRISLSDFLNRKLQKSSVSPKSILGKERPFSFPVSSADAIGSTEGGNGGKRSGEPELTCVLDVVLEQFKKTSKEKQDCIHSNAEGAVENGSRLEVNDGCIGSSAGGGVRIQQVRDSRKRANPFQFQGRKHKQSAQKGLVVLGGDPRLKRRGKQQRLNSTEKPRPIFNHYANGSGWWDSDMEGVDNDEVGYSEVWEGVGTTTLGGLDWH